MDNKLEQTVNIICSNSHCHLFFPLQDSIREAIHFYTRAQCYSNAIRLAKVIQHFKDNNSNNSNSNNSNNNCNNNKGCIYRVDIGDKSVGKLRSVGKF